jgi:hypothetical protein
MPCIIPMAGWSTHADKHDFTCPSHRHKGGKPAALKKIAIHVAESCGLDISQSANDVKIPDVLPEPLSMGDSREPQRQALYFAYLCPHTSADGSPCAQWVARNTSYRGAPEAELWRHITKAHPGVARRRSYQGQWTQNIRIHPDIKKRLLLPPEWHPAVQVLKPTPLFDRPECVALPGATWMAELKWEQYRTSLGRFGVRTLQDLIAPPSMQSIAKKSGNAAHLEAGLLVLHKEAFAYLRSANEFASNQQLAVRAGLTDRYEFHATFSAHRY